MDTTEDLAENRRKQMGFIKISNKSYPIYEGLNIIGRDLKATVRLTNLKFSKQHAVLSVVDETTHLISDFGSSNGTEVKRNKLTPFKFYKIQDREPIIFGDVVGVYHMSVDSTHQEAEADTTQSQMVDHISSTQLVTQNIHDLPTQLFDKNTTQNIHEAVTQEINKTDTNIHDLDTQILEISKPTVDDDLALSRTETYDDVFANDSFRISLQPNISKYDIVVDETLPTDSKLDNSVINKSNNISIDDDDIILSTQDNEMIDKQSLELLKKTKKLEPASEVKSEVNKDDSDSETDIEDEEELRKKIQQIDKNESLTKIQNKLDDSDSETDAEEDLLSKKINQEPDNSDSDTDIEDNILSKLPVSKTLESSSTIDMKKSKSTTVVFSDEEEELDLLAPTQKLQNVEFLAPAQPTKLVCDDADDDLPATLLLQTKNNDEIQEVDDDDLLLVPTQLLESKKPENIQNPIHEDDIDLLAPTQLLESKRNETKKQHVQGEDDDDNDLAPTQLLSGKKTENIQNQIQEDNIDFLAPTQLLESKNKENNKEQVHDEHDDDDLAPTQLLSGKKTENIQNQIQEDNTVFLAPTQLLESKNNENNKEQVHDEHDDDYLAPTQILESKKTENNKEQVQDDDVDDLPPTQLLQSNKPDESIFTAPTQILEKSTTHIFSSPKKSSILSTKSPKDKQKRSVNFSEDVIYDMPTQKLTPTLENKEKLNKTNDDIHSAETQPLEKNKDEQNDSGCSSISGINSLNNTRESVENLSAIKLVLSETEDESICESSKTVPSKTISESETQLEVEFALETQKLYIEEKTSRPDNPVGNMFAEEQTQMTEEIIETTDSKKETNAGIETSRRLQVQLEDIKASTSKPTSASDENDFKQEPLKRGRKKKIVDTVAQNAPKLNITRVKTSEDTKNNNTKIQKTDSNDSLTKSSETDDETKPHNTRGKRISYQKLNSGKTIKSEPKKPLTRGKQPKSSPSVKELEIITPKKSSRISEKPQTREKLKTTKKETKEIDQNENSSDMDDFINRVTRSSKRTHSVATPRKSKPKEEKNVVEDSDDDISPTKKKVVKLQYTDDSEFTPTTTSSNSSVIRAAKQPKRSMKIEDYSSDENENKNICLNTPNNKRRKFEPLNVTVSSTQNTSGEIVKHKVVFTMLNDTKLEGAVKKLGGSVTDSVQECTVLVTNKITRSLKFLVAVALGKPIVETTWITESIQKNSFQDPWNYLLEDKESENKFKFTLKESLHKSVQNKLFMDVVVLLATKKNASVLKEIIETSGGKCISRVPAKNGKAIVVSYEEDKAKYSKYLKQKSLTVVSAEAIFSGILQQELQWKQHLLS